MRRYLTLLIIMVLLLNLGACGSKTDNNNTTAAAGSGSTTGSAQQTTQAAVPAGLDFTKEVQLCNEGGITVSITPMETDDRGDWKGKVKISNKNEHELSVTLKNLWLNDYSQTEKLYAPIKAGEEKDRDFTINYAFLESTGIKELLQMKFLCEITDYSSKEVLFSKDFTLNGANASAKQPDPAGLIQLVHENGIDVNLVPKMIVDKYNSVSLVFFGNGTYEKTVIVSLEGIMVNDVLCEKISKNVGFAAGKRSVDSAINSLPIKKLNLTDISEMKTLSFRMRLGTKRDGTDLGVYDVALTAEGGNFTLVSVTAAPEEELEKK